MKEKIKTVLLVLGLLCGVGMVFYPTVSNWLMGHLSNKVIGNYRENIDQLSDDEIQNKKEAAREYNATLPNGEDYEAYGGDTDSSVDILNLGEVLGYVEIPSIDVDLPIYGGTSEAVLQKGVGHLNNTSLPVGGTGTHVGLSAHRGLPSAKLFSDLDKLVIGDLFYIHVLDEVLAYRVDKIQVTPPYISHELDIEKDKDYVTLITCTPYGINTHRLLVRGERISYTSGSGEVTVNKVKVENNQTFYAVICTVLLLINSIVLFYAVLKYRKK